MDKLQQKGKIRHYGVSVETVEEGLLSMENPNVAALQVIFNIFRQKPMMELFPVAKKKKVGILARVPLASGLLTGKFQSNHQFEQMIIATLIKTGKPLMLGKPLLDFRFIKV